MSDLISREALIKEIEHGKHPEFYDGQDIAGWQMQCIENAPAVDAEPVKHVEWTHLGGDEWRCTHCGEVIHTEGGWEKPTYKYCRECGARMDGGEEN